MSKGNPKKREELSKAWNIYKTKREKIKKEYEEKVLAINGKYKEEK